MTNDAPKPLDELIGGHTVAMLMTMIGGEHTSRPLMCAEVSGDRISFLVDRETDWAAAISAGTATVHLTVSDERRNNYLSLNGTASISQDRAEIERLWNPAAGSYFRGPDDPGLVVLTFDTESGEYWDGPSGRIGAAIALLRTRITGNPADAGDHGDVAT